MCVVQQLYNTRTVLSKPIALLMTLLSKVKKALSHTAKTFGSGSPAGVSVPIFNFVGSSSPTKARCSPEYRREREPASEPLILDVSFTSIDLNAPELSFNDESLFVAPEVELERIYPKPRAWLPQLQNHRSHDMKSDSGPYLTSLSLWCQSKFISEPEILNRCLVSQDEKAPSQRSEKTSDKDRKSPSRDLPPCNLSKAESTSNSSIHTDRLVGLRVCSKVTICTDKEVKPENAHQKQFHESFESKLMKLGGKLELRDVEIDLLLQKELDSLMLQHWTFNPRPFKIKSHSFQTQAPVVIFS